jgi:hypothetical protein
MFLVFSLLMAMNKRGVLAAIEELVRSHGLMLVGGSFEALHFERKYYVAAAITGALGLYLTVAGFAG